MITGQAKTDYQREYMKAYRASSKARGGIRPDLVVRPALDPVRPKDNVRPVLDPDVRPKRLDLTKDLVRPPEVFAKYTEAVTAVPKPQGHSPMMVGYVPPKENL